MRVVANLVRDLASDELRRPFGLQLPAEHLERWNQIHLPMASRAVQPAGLALGEFRRHMARERTKSRQRKRVQRRALLSGEAVIRRWRLSQAIAGRHLVPLRHVARMQSVQRRSLELVLQLEAVTIQTASRLHQLLTALDHRSIRRRRLQLGLGRSRKEPVLQLLRLLLAKMKIWHPRPRIVRVRFAQELRELAQRELLRDAFLRQLRWIGLLGVRRIMAADAVQALVERLRLGVRRLTLAFRQLVLLRLVSHFRELHLAACLERREVGRDRFGVFLRLRTAQNLRHLRARTQRFRIENPASHPIVIPPRTDALERRRIHLELRHTSVGELRIRVTVNAPVIQEQLATQPQLSRLLQRR